MDLYESLTTDTVAHLNPAPAVAIDPDSTVADAVAKMRDHRIGSVVICRSERLVGIFTERDALRIMAKGGDFGASIETVMTANPVAVTSSDSIWAALTRMYEGGYRRMPITDSEGRPTGIVSTRRIVHYLVEHFPTAVYNLPPVAQPTTRDREGA